MFKKAIIVVEIGCNHQGKIDKAKKLIEQQHCVVLIM